MYSVPATRSRKHAGASKAEWRHQGGQSNLIVPSKAIVLESVRSLYADGLEPFGRIVLRRARELCAAARSRRKGCSAGGDEGRCVDPAALRKICQEIPELEVVPLGPHEHRVLLVGVAANFVDVGSNEDNYPPELWTAASTYLDGLRGSAAMLPGGRYACAVELIERRAPFTEGRSLGEVCHIVQLAVARRKLFGYSDGHMVPYSSSEDAAKERAVAAEESAPGVPSKAVADATPSKSPAALPGAGEVTLGAASASDANRLARCQGGLELDEAALRFTEPQQDCRFLDSQFVSLRALRLRNASQASPRAAPATTPRATNAQDVTHRPAPLAVGVAARTTAPTAPKPPPGLELPAQLRSAPSSPQRATAWCLSTSPMSAGPPRSPTGSLRAEAAQCCPAHQSESSPVSFGVAPPPLLLPGVSPAGAPPTLTQPSVLRPGHIALPLGAAAAGASPTSPPLGLEFMAPCGCCALLPPARAQEPVEAQCRELGAAWSGLRELLSTQVQRLLELDDPQQRATLSALQGAAPQVLKTSPRTYRSSSHGSTSARVTSDCGSITDFESSRFALDASLLGGDHEAEELLPTMLVAYKAMASERRQAAVKKGQQMEE